MAQANRSKLVTTFRYPVRVDVRRPKFERSASLAYIDAAKLERAARAEFEVGHLETVCCRARVLAVVRRGMVTALRVERCAECKAIRPTPELTAMLEAARRRIGRRRAAPFRPMPVAQFTSGVAETIIEEPCSEFCIVIGGYGFCVVCCGRGSERWCSIRVVVPKAEERLQP